MQYYIKNNKRKNLFGIFLEKRCNIQTINNFNTKKGWFYLFRINLFCIKVIV